MALQQAIFLGIVVVFSGHIYTGFAAQNECKTYGSGVFYTFNKTAFHLKSTCPVTLTQFTHAGVNCHIIVQRGLNGLMDRVEIIVNKITTLIHNNTVTVEGSRIPVPYDHTYQYVFHYGIYTRLKSKVLPLSVTWYSVSSGVSSLWVQLDQVLVEGMSGLCGHQNSSETMQQLISASVLSDGQCLTQDSVKQDNIACKVLSHALECLGKKLYNSYLDLCQKHMNGLWHQEANCSFFKEISLRCGSSSQFWSEWRSNNNCSQPLCPGDLYYQEMGPAFPPTCSNPQNNTTEFTSTCLPAGGKVLNDHADGYHSINVEECPCVYAKKMYAPGQERRTKCQNCTCTRGKWTCSPNKCPAKCIIEGQFITTFDGKQYSLLDRCTFVAARGLNWTLNIQYSVQTVVIEKAYLNINQERYTFSANSIQMNNMEISDLSQTESTTVFWQSSMFIQVQTSFGLKMQVQISPEIQIYLNLPPTENTKGLCGTFNNDTSDDFTTFSGIIESSAQLFAQSWSMGSCTPITGCINTDNQIFAENNCEQLKDPKGVFAVCHDYVPVLPFVEACVKRTCQCSAALQECLCVSFGNYAKACATQGITVEDWRSETNCIPPCMGNLRFTYATLACNHTCRSLSGPDPTCEVLDDPVEGCACTSDSHLSNQLTCSPRSQCNCHHPGGIAPPGPVVIGGRQCLCENGQLHCPKICNCTVGKICVDCLQIPVNTAHRTCESLTKPVTDDNSCISGCYCPGGLFEDHYGGCVTHENCTCEFSGRVYETGQSVETNCKICTCRGGEWSCIDEACSGVCEVFGNGQYHTFDSKWYKFDGHCQYTLVKDASSSGQFAIKSESVPCCDESLTCSRAISVELLGTVTLLLSDMKVTEKFQAGNALLAEPLYYIHTVGLYIIITAPSLGITVIWDKHTRVTIQLVSQWRGRVLGLCGNFDGKVTNDLLTSSSSEVFSVLDFGNSWKRADPPCSDVTHEIFPCERHSYCAAWAQRRCMILISDTFKDCHLKVDPEPYYQACVLESCSCEFEGKFLGFCTAVSAYAEACNAKDVCINWRSPDLCPVYCDYYNDVGISTWHYDPCGQVKTCGTNKRFTGKLEGCYPRCPEETPYYDENIGKCTTLDNCTCSIMNRVLSPPDEICTPYKCCKCFDGQIVCISTTTTTTTTTVSYTSTAQPSTTAMTHTTTTQPTTQSKTKHITQPPTTQSTTKYTTQPTTSQSTTKYTTQSPTTVETTKYTMQTSTTERATEYTTTTHPSTTESTTESYTTPVEETTTQQTTTQTTTEYTTHLPPTESTTESYTIPMEGTTTLPPTSEGTREYTTQLPTTESTTESYPTPMKGTTTTQLPPTESTTEYTTTKQQSTTEDVTEEYTPVEETTSTSQSTPEYTTQKITTKYSTTKTTTIPTTEEYTTLVEETTTTSQSPTSQSTTESATQKPTTKYTTQKPTTRTTTEEYTTPLDETTTRQPTSQSTTEYTTKKTTKYTTQKPTTRTTTEEYTTPLDETTTQQTTTQTTTEYTTHLPPTESTTESYTIPMEGTTTLPPTSEGTREYTTQLPTTESTTEYTTTKQQSTTEDVTEEYTPVEETTSTSQSTPEYTTQKITTKYSTTKTTTIPTTEEYTTLVEETTTSQSPTSQSTTESTTQKPTTKYTTQKPTTRMTTEEYTTPLDETTTRQPTSQSTTEYTTKKTTKYTTQKPTTRTTTEEYTTLLDETTTRQPTSQSTTESTTQKPTTKYTTQKPTTRTTTEEYTTLLDETTTRQPTSQSTTEYTTQKPTTKYTTQKPTTRMTTEEYTTPLDETTTQQTISQSTTEYTTKKTTKYTTQKPTTRMTTEEYTTPLDETTTRQLTSQSTTQLPTTEGITESHTTLVKDTTTTQRPTTESTKEYKTTTRPLTRGSTQTTAIPTEYTKATQPTTEATTSVKNSTPVTTVTTTDFVIVTGSAITTLNVTSHQEHKTTINPTTMTPSTKMPVSNTTIPTTEHTTPVCECNDVMRNQSWSCGETWREDCADKYCNSGVIEVKSITCPTPQDRTDCPGNKMTLVKDKETCCESYMCDCQCQIYGDPHYISFQGIKFDFMDNCTYTLVEEKKLQHRLSITVDNYYCLMGTDESCARGITLKYWNDTVTLMATEDDTVESTLNQEIIKPPYENQVFKFESTETQAYIYLYIKPIRSYVSLTKSNTLLINLASEHFQNNTIGQCGGCGGPSCIRRNGVVEDDNCCHKTAYDWVVEDPLKPYCKSAPINVPCFPAIPPPPTPTQPPCNAPICDLLHHKVFAECSERINLTSVVDNCRFDYCSSNRSVIACSSLEYAASECKRIGICVDWRNLTNDSCEITCPEGMTYDECRESPNDVCRGGVRVPATSVVGLRSGCFCPDGHTLAEDHKQICVPECTKCKGPLGEPMPVGAVWESNCHICTCNNQTRTEECVLKPPGPPPVCGAFSVLVSDCCGNQICVEKTCDYNGTIYKLGDRWKDPLRPCESFTCSPTGTEVEKTVCPLQTCAEDLRVWDEHHCCYSCNATCAARVTRMNLTIADCTQEVELPICDGECKTHNRWIQTNGTLQLEQSRQCCKERGYVMRDITLTCSKSSLTHFTYRHVTSCECKAEG